MNGYFIGASIFALPVPPFSGPLLLNVPTVKWLEFCKKPFFASKKAIFARHWAFHAGLRMAA